LERAGFVLRNVSGSHHRYVYPGDPTRWTVVPMHNRDLKPGTLRAILAQARITPEEFLDLL
jgi:predicted RNA binding protein YcfA (HicA-like mRNA interferase family)